MFLLFITFHSLLQLTPTVFTAFLLLTAIGILPLSATGTMQGSSIT